MAIKFSREQVLQRLNFENPWWSDSGIDEYYQKMKRRGYFKLFLPLILEKSIKRAIVLMGPRRVGKTVMLYHTISELLNNQKIDRKSICYISIETPIYNGISLEELLNIFLDLHGLTKDQKLFIFFDEIQYLKDWEIHLKSLVDSYHNIKFIVSGSAAAALKLKSAESGAGRFTEFILPPLTFHEFLMLTDSESIIKSNKVFDELDPTSFKFEYETTDIKTLNNKFLDYINYGGYPEVSLSKAIQEDPGRYIRNDIIDKVLLRDLPSLYGITDIQELNSLFTYIAYNTGAEMSLDQISKNSGVAKNTIKRYIKYLEAAFLIKVVQRIDQNAKKFKRANFFKIYITNPSIRTALFSPIDYSDQHMGNLVETAIFSQWNHSSNFNLHYARWNKGEIDIVYLDRKLKPSWCLEIKWSDRYSKNLNELKNLKVFCIKHNLEEALITSKLDNSNVLVDGVNFIFKPSSLYCYTVGRNILKN